MQGQVGVPGGCCYLCGQQAAGCTLSVDSETNDLAGGAKGEGKGGGRAQGPFHAGACLPASEFGEGEPPEGLNKQESGLEEFA